MSFFRKHTKEKLSFSNFGYAILFYLIFSYLYFITLRLNRFDSINSISNFFDLASYAELAGLQYLIKFLLSLPIWWLIFIVVKERPLKTRLLFHAVTLPVWVLLSQYVHYTLADELNWSRLTGTMRVWDLYIPILLYFIQFSILHAYDYYQKSKRHLKQQAALKEAALKSELAALKAQLNPHFLYNAFNTISASVPEGSEGTRELVAQLSDIFRYQLKSSQEEEIVLHEEIAFLSKYLSIEKARFGDRLNYSIHVPEHLLDRKIPSMFLQPIIENSIIHGISPLISGGDVCLKVSEVEGKLLFEISDTGAGVKNKKMLFGKGVGLTNTRLRLEKMYHTTLNISDNVPSGLIVSFVI